MLYYVSKLDWFSQEYGDVDSVFYESAENNFYSALELIDKIWSQKELFEEVTKVAKKIHDFEYWWWFSDTIDDYYFDWVKRNNLEKGYFSKYHE